MYDSPQNLQKYLYELNQFELKKDINIDRLDEIVDFLSKYEYLTHFNQRLNKFGYSNIYEFRRAYINGEPAAHGYCSSFVFAFISRVINHVSELNFGIIKL